MQTHRSSPSHASVVLVTMLLAAFGPTVRDGISAGDPPTAVATVAPAAAADLPVPDDRPLSSAERLRVTLLGGNPIFALDWLASGLELQGERPAPPRPRVPLP